MMTTLSIKIIFDFKYFEWVILLGGNRKEKDPFQDL